MSRRVSAVLIVMLAAGLASPDVARASELPRPVPPSTPAPFEIGMAPVLPTTGAVCSADAQSASGGVGDGFGFGVKGGWLYSNLQAAKSDFTHRGGFIGGVFFASSRPGASVATEVLYLKKGAELAGQTTDLYYLEVPVLLRVKGGSRGMGFYGIGGPAFDIKLKDSQTNFNVKANYESLDLGFIVGAGIEASRLIVEGRYNWGLRNILKAGGGLTGLTGVTDIKTRSFALMAGVRFN